MDFYFTVSIIAVIILIILLTTIGLLVKNSSYSGKFPPHTLCPDYWEVDGSLCIVPVDDKALNSEDNHMQIQMDSNISIIMVKKPSILVIHYGQKIYYQTMLKIIVDLPLGLI